MRIMLSHLPTQSIRISRMFPKLSRKTIRLLYGGFLLYLTALLGYVIRRTDHIQYQYLFNSVESYWWDEELHFISKEGESQCPKQDGGFCKTPCWNGLPYKEPGFVVTPNITRHRNSDLIIHVYSALGNINKRKNIRDEFHATMKNEKELTVQLAFIVGLPTTDKDEVNNRYVQHEHELHDDILQINITDVYNHLGYKGIAGLKWTMQTTSPNTKQYGMKLDDDSFMGFTHMTTLLMVAKELKKRHNEVKNELLCLYVMYEVLVYEPKQKIHWESTFHQYYARKYPHFCHGAGGIYFTNEVATRMYQAAQDVPVFHLDDNYMTGLLRERACIKLRDWSGLWPFLESLMYTFLNLYSYDDWFAYKFLKKDFIGLERRHRKDPVIT